MKSLGSPHLTPGYQNPEFVRQIKSSVCGMAFFAATGPFGAACKDCAFYGFSYVKRNKAGNPVKTVNYTSRCAMFHQLTNKVGDTIPDTTEACKYFRKE